jgi:hypothetical protein
MLFAGGWDTYFATIPIVITYADIAGKKYRRHCMFSFTAIRPCYSGCNGPLLKVLAECHLNYHMDH